jgi:hypothetical protein
VSTPWCSKINYQLSHYSAGLHQCHIKARKERTSTSPSGRHLGHYKLLVKTYKDKTGSTDLQAAAGQILKLMVNMMDLASDKGFILDRWTKVINAMIYKKTGVYLIHKL